MNELKFLHIPKTGGSSIEHAANKVGLMWGKFDKSLKAKHSCKWHTPQIVKGFDMFSIVRDPYDKIISQFYHKNKVGSYTSLRLNKWVENVLRVIPIKPHFHQNHFYAQKYFVQYSTYVLCFDRLQADLTALLSIYGLPPMKLGHHYGGGRQNRKRRNANFKRLKKKDFSRDIRLQIQKFYKEDFQIYNLISTLDGPYKVKLS